MATIGNYKEYARQARTMTVEDLFNLGMSYVDTPLNEGFAKLLVNFDLKNQGTSLVPRGGLKTVESDLAGKILDPAHTYAVHHVGMTMVQSVSGNDAKMHRYVLLAPVVLHTVLGTQCYYFNELICILEADAGFLSASISQELYSNVRPKLSEIHGVPLQTSNQYNRGLFVSIEANTYIPVFNVTNTVRKFVRLELQFTSDLTFTIAVPQLEPKDISASQVINTGYNMMKSDPYSFTNVSNANNALLLNGMVPKDANGNVKLTSDVGESLTYHLNYSYPTADIGVNTYKVQWEINDTSTGTTTQVLQQVRKSANYTPGDPITLTITVPYKQFTVIVKMYNTADVTAKTYVSDDDDYKNLTPRKVLTVSSYYTSSGTARNAANLTAKKYDMTTCKGMATWQQRVVLWGVNNAATTLFVSQPNLPEYVPYPNNVEVFSEDIVRCIPYLTYLLVFTTSKLYQLTLVNDGLTDYYTVKCIQENLVMNEEDSSTIQVVKNMLYFKSGNYFYMIVPNSNAGAGELQLAPVSRPIEQLLDHFHDSVIKIVDSVYNINYTFNLKAGADDSYTLTFVDYYNYLDGAIMRNAYKIKISIYNEETLVSTRYIDFVLNYDTLFRAWTTYLYESNAYRFVPYENNVTSGITLLSIKTTTADKARTAQLIRWEPTSPKDEVTFINAGSPIVFHNHQLIDTGYRAHFPQYKKRFRELQFSVNNTGKDTLQFYTAFVVDDDSRKDLFNYTVQQIVDKTSPDYGLIYVERTLNEGITVAGELQFDATGWTLDFSKFPEITVAKVRYKVSGKGYLGKATILNKDEVLYELLGTNWVYRKMNGR